MSFVMGKQEEVNPLKQHWQWRALAVAALKTEIDWHWYAASVQRAEGRPNKVQYHRTCAEAIERAIKIITDRVKCREAPWGQQEIEKEKNA